VTNVNIILYLHEMKFDFVNNVHSKQENRKKAENVTRMLN
jgi:hypothetical protein